jgi:hypothetical protein
MVVQSQRREIVPETPSQKTPHKRGLVAWLKVQALSSNPSATKKKKKKKRKQTKIDRSKSNVEIFGSQQGPGKDVGTGRVRVEARCSVYHWASEKYNSRSLLREVFEIG